MKRLLIIYIIHPWEEIRYKIDSYKINEETKDFVVNKSKFIKKPAKKFWNKIEKIIEEEYEEPYEKMKIYIDGCDSKPTIDDIRTAARASDNYRLVLKLVEKGATVLKTESKKILDDMQDQLIDIRSFEEDMEKITSKRHKYIADQINNTLGENEEGLLFLGFMHMQDDIIKYLKKDIDARHLIIPELMVCVKKTAKQLMKTMEK